MSIQLRPGDKCEIPGCTGRLVVYTTRINFAKQRRTRYMHCECCGHAPDKNKWSLPLEYAPARKQRRA